MEAAVIGCGRMGAFTSEAVRRFAPECWFPLAHAEAIKAAGSIDLVALCDANEDNLVRAAQEYGVARTYTDHGTMLENTQPDLVGIATRTIGRAAIIADCHQAGTRGFHIEKPICNSVAELEQLEILFSRDDTFVTLGAVRRHFAIYREAVSRALSGQFGPLVEARVDMGSAPLFWTHPHSVDLILLAASGRKVDKVQAKLGPVEREGSTIRNDPTILSANIWFEDGMAGHIGRAPGVDFCLACETARFEVLNDGHSLWQAEITDENPYPEPTRRDFTAPDIPQGALAPISQLAACLAGDRQARTANANLKADILQGQRILFAMVQSHLEGGCPVSLGEVDPSMVIEARSGQFYA